jgi:hypothetical protein
MFDQGPQIVCDCIEVGIFYSKLADALAHFGIEAS